MPPETQDGFSASDTDDAQSVPVGEGRRTNRYNRAMRWVRRFHMYLGLFMFPWILLYGITGFLLNHPGAFPDHEVQKVTEEKLSDAGLNKLPKAQDYAQKLFDIIVKDDRGKLDGYKFVGPESARYRHQANMNTTRSGKRYNLSVNPVEQKGLLHIRPMEQGRQTPLGSMWSLNFDDPARMQLQQSAINVLKELGVVTDAVNMQWGPVIEFDISKGDETWTVIYNIGNRNLLAKPRKGWPGITSVRQYLLRLHFAHTFPAEISTRTFWAVMVDAMALVMVLWACTGFLMWWQRRSVRLTGAIVITVSVLWASGLAYLMYEVFRH